MKDDEMVRILAEAPTLFNSETRLLLIPAALSGLKRRSSRLRIRVENFDEVEKGFVPFQARKEAARCLRCYRMVMAAF